MISNRLVACLFLLGGNLFSLAFEPPEKHCTALKEQGYVEIEDTSYLQEDYRRLYRSFDRFIEQMTQDELSFQEMRSSETEFLSSEKLKNRYCGTPPSYRDPRQDFQKKHRKIYFQFINEHYTLLKNNHPGLFQKNAEFFEEMMKIDTSARTIYSALFENIDGDCSKIEETLYGKHSNLTIVSKIVRYEQSQDWGTSPHFDKSGLSLVWDSSDANYNCFVLDINTAEPSLNQLRKPKRTFIGAQKSTSVILIPGLCLSKVKINIHPTLHAVLPLEQPYRYAVISFVLVPDIDTKDMATDFVPTKDEL
ncbi:MAG: hypothetical protein WCK49_03135 [Myxococcaceae bacterium]